MQSKGVNEPDCLLENAVLLARRIRRAHMHMAQVTQHGFIFLAHTASKVGVIQMLIPRRFRHVLQHIQSALDRALPPRR